MLVGAYSSVFVAVPLAVDLKLRDPAIKAHTARVLAKRKAEGLIVDADGDPISRGSGRHREGRRPGRHRPLQPVVPGMKPGGAPKPGVKPARPGSGRPTVTDSPDATTDAAAAGVGHRRASAPAGRSTSRRRRRRPMRRPPTPALPTAPARRPRRASTGASAGATAGRQERPARPASAAADRARRLAAALGAGAARTGGRRGCGRPADPAAAGLPDARGAVPRPDAGAGRRRTGCSDVRGLATAVPTDGVDLVAGLEARGFLLAAALAMHRGTGVLADAQAGQAAR